MKESQQIASEQHNHAEHAHRSGAEQHGKENHATGHEASRRALEHSNTAYLQAQEQHDPAGDGFRPGAGHATEQEIAALAYQLWQARHCPEGSPDQDWFRAVETLRSGH